jgi:hypothetical protein
VLIHLLAKLRLHWLSVTADRAAAEIREYAPLG